MTDEEFERTVKRLLENLEIFRGMTDRDRKKYLRGVIRKGIVDLTQL